MLDWHSCQICYPLEIKLLLLLFIIIIIEKYKKTILFVISLSLIGSGVHRSRNRVKDRWTQSHLIMHVKTGSCY